jgi:Holliday junction resolvase RusA-like endonuclease
MKTIQLSKNEERALKALLMRSRVACSSGCAFPEMQKSKKDCDKCNYPKAIEDVMEKLGMYE